MIIRLISVLAALFTAAPHASPAPSPSARPHHVVVAPVHPAHAARAASRPRFMGPVNGADVSWPNCPRTVGIPGRHGYALPMPQRTARFVVVGATNGPAFTRNACLTSQVRWVKNHHLWLSAYEVVHYPTRAELRRFGGRHHSLTRVGVAEARHALTTLRRSGLRPSMVWLDVETVGGHPWSSNRTLNRALLRGAAHELRRQHVRVGFYSNKSSWNRITGGWRSILPTWVPTGSAHRADALARCRKRSFSGGRVLMTQWTTGNRDLNLTCPGVAPKIPMLFRKT